MGVIRASQIRIDYMLIKGAMSSTDQYLGPLFFIGASQGWTNHTLIVIKARTLQSVSQSYGLFALLGNSLVQ